MKMNFQLQKLSDLEKIDSFFQLDYDNGYKYIDVAGAILTDLKKEHNIKIFDINVNQLAVQSGDNELLKVGVRSVWMHFTKIDSFDQILSKFKKNYKVCLKNIGIDEITRIGWRNYFLYKLNKKEDVKDFFDEIFVNKTDVEFNTLSGSFDYKDGIQSNINIQYVKHKDKEEYGILFDIDMYKLGKFTLEASDNIMDSIVKFYHNDGDLIPFLNKFFTTKKGTDEK